MAWETPEFRKKDKPLIAICLPNKGSLPLEFVYRTWVPILGAHAPEFDTVALLNRHYSLTVARNSMVEDAIAANADYVMWVDDDMLVEDMGVIDAIRSMYFANGDIVSGLYRSKQKEGFFINAWIKVGQNGEQSQYAPISSWPEHGTFAEVNVVGHGFCLVKTDVYKKMKKPWYVWNEKTENSEDFSWCERAAKEAGAKVFAHLAVHLSHIGELVVKYDGTVRTTQL